MRNRVIDFLSRYRLETAAQEVLEQAAAADPEEDVPALVQFLLHRHRFLPARIALEGWLSPDSGRYTKAAELFKEAGYPLEAEALLRLALRFDAQNRPAVDALLELLIARNDVAGARHWIEASYRVYHGCRMAKRFRRETVQPSIGSRWTGRDQSQIFTRCRQEF